MQEISPGFHMNFCLPSLLKTAKLPKNPHQPHPWYQLCASCSLGPYNGPTFGTLGMACGWLQWESSAELQTCSHHCLPSSRHQNPEHGTSTNNHHIHSLILHIDNIKTCPHVRRRTAWKDSRGSSTLCSVVLFVSVFLGWRRKNTTFWKLYFGSLLLGLPIRLKDIVSAS